MPLTIFPVLLLNILFNALGQISLKYGVDKVGSLEFSFANIWHLSLQLATNPWIIGGLFLYMLSMCVWFFILSRVDVSIAYPMISLAYIINAIGAYYMLGEQITILRLSGIVVILVGVFLVARS